MSSLAAITNIIGYNPEVHDRFDSSMFLGAAFDWTGVGKGAGGGWATLVSANTFISANHAHPGMGSNVTFWEGNLSTSPTVERTVIGGRRIGDTDLWVGTLDQAVPGTIAAYDLGPGISDISTGLDSYANQLVYNVGLGGTLNFVVGQNRYDVSDATPPILGTFDAIGFIQDQSGNPNFIDINETFLQDGDSGAPSFIVDGGVLKLAGIHSYIEVGISEVGFNAIFDFRTPESTLVATGSNISVDTFVPTYRDQIFNGVPNAVPEPPAALFILSQYHTVFRLACYIATAEACPRLKRRITI